MQHFIGSYGYLAILLLMIAESACIPVPSELTMPLGGALAAGAVAGVHLSLVPVIAVGVAGNLIGSYIAWAVGPVRRPVRGSGDRLGILGGQAGVERAQRWFDRYGGRAVFFGRLLPAIRTFISLPAGFARMPALRFGLYTVAGCVPWIAGLALAGYAAGANWQHVDTRTARTVPMSWPASSGCWRSAPSLSRSGRVAGAGRRSAEQAAPGSTSREQRGITIDADPATARPPTHW